MLLQNCTGDWTNHGEYDVFFTSDPAVLKKPKTLVQDLELRQTKTANLYSRFVPSQM